MNSRFRTTVMLLLAIANGSSYAQAETYYVTQSSRASDDNNGSSRRPWRTISAAAQRAQAGDTVFVAAGDYRDEDTGWGLGVIPLLNSGTQSQPIRFRTNWGARPLVSRMFLKDCSHVIVEGFHFSGACFEEMPGWTDMPTIVRDTVAPERPDYEQPWENRQEQVEAEFATYFGLIHLLEYRSAIDVENGVGIKLTNNIIDGYWAGIQCRHCERVTIACNRISHSVNGIFTWQSPALVDSEISFNTITHSLDNGIDIREGSQNVRVDQNYVSLSGRSHIAFLNGVSDSRVRNNVVTYGGYYSESMEYPGSSAINIHSSLSGNVVQGNLAAYQVDLTEVDGNGIILDLMRDGASVTVRNNILWRNMGDGLNTTISPNAVIKSNSFIENGYGAQGYRRGAGIKLARNEDLQQTILNNTFLFNRAAGIMSYHIIDQQKDINRNQYITLFAPMIWDGYSEDDRAYHTLRAIRSRTPWERNGWGISLYWW